MSGIWNRPAGIADRNTNCERIRGSNMKSSVFAVIPSTQGSAKERRTEPQRHTPVARSENVAPERKSAQAEAAENSNPMKWTACTGSSGRLKPPDRPNRRPAAFGQPSPDTEFHYVPCAGDVRIGSLVPLKRNVQQRQPDRRRKEDDDGKAKDDPVNGIAAGRETSESVISLESGFTNSPLDYNRFASSAWLRAKISLCSEFPCESIVTTAGKSCTSNSQIASGAPNSFIM